MRSSLIIGFVAALCPHAYGAAIHDTVRQAVGDTPLSLLHDAEDATSVRLGKPPNTEAESWRFELVQGYTEAYITPINSNRTLVCQEGSKCRLDPEGSKQIYHAVPNPGEKHNFTIQDTESKLYVSWTSDLDLALAPQGSDSIYFELQSLDNKKSDL